MSIAIASSNFIFLDFLCLLQGSMLCPLAFLIYINNIFKQLAVDYALFFIFHFSRIKRRFKSKSEWTSIVENVI